MRILISFAVLGVFLLLAGASRAEEPGGPPPPDGEAIAGPPAPTLHGELALSVLDAIAMSIENNLDVELARYQPLISDLDHRIAWGAHDPILFGSFEYASTETPVASPFQGTDTLLVERETTGGAGIGGLVPKLGWEYEIAYGGQRLQTTSRIQDLSPEYRANLTGTLTMPLLKGFWWGEPWVAVKQTGIGSELADEEFRRNLMDLIAATETAYWAVSATDERGG